MTAVSRLPAASTECDHTMAWPRKYELFGLGISAATYEEAEQAVLDAARQRLGGIVTHFSVHGVATAALDPEYRSKINQFDMVAADGQPVRWALNRFHGAGLCDRLYGPELMLRLCRAAARDEIGVYLYGSSPEVLEKLRSNLLRRFPGLRLVGCESPPFRPLTRQEKAATVARINASGAGLLFIGLGCPRQDLFAYEQRRVIKAVQLCVGAAFDFHAGTKRMAPQWMQKRGLEWLFRMCQEPARLSRRYLHANTIFLFLVGRRIVLGR